MGDFVSYIDKYEISDKYTLKEKENIRNKMIQFEKETGKHAVKEGNEGLEISGQFEHWIWVRE